MTTREIKNIITKQFNLEVGEKESLQLNDSNVAVNQMFEQSVIVYTEGFTVNKRRGKNFIDVSLNGCITFEKGIANYEEVKEMTSKVVDYLKTLNVVIVDYSGVAFSIKTS